MYIVTSTRAQSREVHAVPYRVTTVTERKFFGFEPASIEGTTVQVSGLEKTLVDCADHPEFGGGLRELATAMRTDDERDRACETVGGYLERLDNGAATERIVYLTGQLGIDLPARGTLVESFTGGYSLLDPTQSETGSTSRTRGDGPTSSRALDEVDRGPPRPIDPVNPTDTLRYRFHLPPAPSV